jgi:Ca2+-binding RTX toxin-like protein
VVTVNQGSGSGAVTGSHVYAAGGIYTITLLLTDDDTGAASATTTAVVTGVGLNNGILFVIGDTQRDNVTINHTGNGRLKVHANFIAQNHRSFDVVAVNQIISYLGDGNDHLNISNHLSIPAIVHGGRGNDHLAGGGGSSVLLGDAGDDHLIGQSGRNILIGGTGRDRLIGGTGDDVLIGGSTNLDQDDVALMSAMTVWNSPIAYSVRVSAINVLWVVSDDGEEDLLTGGAGQDLYYDGVGDVLTGVRSGEVVL